MPSLITVYNYRLSVPDSAAGLRETLEEVTAWAESNGYTGDEFEIKLEIASDYDTDEVSIEASFSRYRTDAEEEDYIAKQRAEAARQTARRQEIYISQVRTAFQANPDAIRELVVELSNQEGD